MTMAVYQQTAVDGAGNVLSTPTITVRKESTGGKARLYADEDGVTPLTNPIVLSPADDGFFRFYVVGGKYRIDMVQGSYEAEPLRNVHIGTAAGMDGPLAFVDYDVAVDELADRDAYDSEAEGYGVLVANIGDGRAAIYVKLSASDGDWSEPAYVTGPDGMAGEPLAVSISDAAGIDAGSYPMELSYHADTTFTRLYAEVLSGTGSAVCYLRQNGVDVHGPFTVDGSAAAIDETISLAMVEDDALDLVVDSTAGNVYQLYAKVDRPASGLVASGIAFAPTGGIAAVTVQTAIAELDTEKAPKASPIFTGSITVGGAAIAIISEGTYVPTLTNTTNVGASTAYTCQWMRVGNIVTVSGRIDVDPTTTTTSTVIGISLPVASNFSGDNQLGGGGAGQGVHEAWGARADPTNDRAELISVVQTASNHAVHFSFMYRVI